jgi:RimJ/RimL family protein N-acetyltransferase
MISLALSTDLTTIRAILTHPRLWPSISDDFSGSPEDFQPFSNEAIFYVLVSSGDKPIGVWMFVKQSPTWHEIHVAFLPKAWGVKANQAARMLAPWVWANTTAQCISARIPAYNRAAIAFARRSGMGLTGKLPKSFQKNGGIVDQVLLSVTRPN